LGSGSRGCEGGGPGQGVGCKGRETAGILIDVNTEENDRGRRRPNVALRRVGGFESNGARRGGHMEVVLEVAPIHEYSLNSKTSKDRSGPRYTSLWRGILIEMNHVVFVDSKGV
jgi:hypothetical protein